MVRLKKSLGILLSIVMILSVFSIIPFTVSAANDDVVFELVDDVDSLDSGKYLMVAVTNTSKVVQAVKGTSSTSNYVDAVTVYEQTDSLDSSDTNTIVDMAEMPKQLEIASDSVADIEWTVASSQDGFSFYNDNNNVYLHNTTTKGSWNNTTYSVALDASATTYSPGTNKTSSPFWQYTTATDSSNNSVNVLKFTDGTTTRYCYLETGKGFKIGGSKKNVFFYKKKETTPAPTEPPTEPPTEAPTEPEDVVIGFTSDVHGNVDGLSNWINKVQTSVGRSLDMMAYCGDYGRSSINNQTNIGPNYIADFESVVTATNTLVAGGANDYSKGVYTVGNHDYQADSNQNSESLDVLKGIHDVKDLCFWQVGPAIDADDYSIFCFGAASNYSSGSETFTDSDIEALGNYLDSAPADEPIFILSHFPLHYYKNNYTTRAIGKAEAVIDVLNEHPELDIYFLWGHNHSQGDPHYGQILESGESIQYTSADSKDIYFTYVSAGGMRRINETIYSGVTATISKSDHTDVTFDYYRSDTGAKLSTHQMTTTRTVTIGDHDHGSITAGDYQITNNEVEVAKNRDVTFTVTPDEGYLIGEVFVDGEAVELTDDGKYTMKTVSKAHTISATFALPDSYTVTATAGHNGTIEPSGMFDVDREGEVTFTVSAEKGYEVDKFLVNGEEKALDDNSQYTISSVEMDYDVSVSFKEPFEYELITDLSNTSSTVAIPEGEYLIVAIGSGNSNYMYAVQGDFKDSTATNKELDWLQMSDTKYSSESDFPTSLTVSDSVAANISNITWRINAYGDTANGFYLYSVKKKQYLGLNNVYSVTFDDKTPTAWFHGANSGKQTLSCSTGNLYIATSNKSFKGGTNKKHMLLYRRKSVFSGHSLTLDGDIGVNYYLNLTADEAKNATVEFSWTVDDVEKKAYVTTDELTAQADLTKGYKTTCPVPAAEINYEIDAKVTITDGNDVKEYHNKYSVITYAKTILATESENSKLATLVKTMLNYGAMAQVKFDRDIKDLVNEGIGYDLQEIQNIDTAIPSTASNMTANLADYGLEYKGTTVVFLSETTLRHYYEIKDQTLFNAVKDDITFDGEKVEYTQKGDEICFDRPNIKAPKLDTPYVLHIGENDYQYSVLDYVRAILKSNSASIGPEMKDLATATYWYNQAAKAYFTV